MDRVLVGGEVAPGVFVGERCLAQHVVRVPKALRLHLARPLQRLSDRLPGDELLAQHLHGQFHPLTDHRFAASADEAHQRAAQ